MINKLFHLPHAKKGLAFLFIFILGLSLGGLIFNKTGVPNILTPKPDKYTVFLSEVYDKVEQNYWDNISDDQLITLFKASAEKLTGQTYKVSFKTVESPNPTLDILSMNNTSNSIPLSGSNINDLQVRREPVTNPQSSRKKIFLKLLDSIFKNISDDKKKEFTAQLASSVLTNLTPNGRSGLFTTKQEEDLKNTVSNINPGKDLYKDLGVEKGASSEAVEKAYQKQAGQLKKENTPEAKRKLDQIAYAKGVLTNNDEKQRYDTAKIEPTIFTKIILGQILYLKILKYSPTTFDEFQKAINSYDKNDGPNALIFDLRGNIGGAIDSLPFFLGNFLGRNQYAFEFYSKGDSTPFKTLADKLPSLNKYHQIVVFIDNNTQSSAELMAASLKRYHAAVILGVPSKGWGTVEKVFSLDNQIDDKEKYSLFLVHSITLRDDSQPIEGRGVDPNISIKDPNWQNQLSSYYRYPELTQAVSRIIQEDN